MGTYEVPSHDLHPVELVDAREQVTRLDRRRRGQLGEVVERSDVAQVDAGAELHAQEA